MKARTKNPALAVPNALEPLLALGANIALINFWNRVNVLTKQVAGSAVR